MNGQLPQVGRNHNCYHDYGDFLAKHCLLLLNLSNYAYEHVLPPKITNEETNLMSNVGCGIIVIH